jgi:hypothetical protein
MANLTSQEVNELANYLLAMAKSISDYRIKNFNTLSPPENQKIKDLNDAILNYADQLYTMSAILVLDDVATALSTINEVTNKMQATYTKLMDVQKAINIAASVVALGESIVKLDPNAVKASIGGIVNTLKTPSS